MMRPKVILYLSLAAQGRTVWHTPQWTYQSTVQPCPHSVAGLVHLSPDKDSANVLKQKAQCTSPLTS